MHERKIFNAREGVQIDRVEHLLYGDLVTITSKASQRNARKRAKRRRSPNLRLFVLGVLLIAATATIATATRPAPRGAKETEPTTYAEPQESGTATADEPIIYTREQVQAMAEIRAEAAQKPLEVPEVVIDGEDLEMLACVIYQEAGMDACCDDCRRRVADVVLNRVADSRFPNTIEEVLTQPKQYGVFDQTGVVWAERANSPEEANAVDRAYRIAAEVLGGRHSDLYRAGYIWQAEFAQGNDLVECCGIYYGRG